MTKMMADLNETCDVILPLINKQHPHEQMGQLVNKDYINKYILKIASH